MYKINQNCVGCHNCAMECPMQAISFVGMKYEIDPDKCVECGLCEKLCHTASISDVDNPEQILKHDLIVKECDVVVCGAGTGLIAAIRAAQAGKKVIVLEKSKKLGGNTDYAHGFFPVYTNLHKKLNLEDAREAAIDVFWERSNKQTGKDLIRAAVYGSGEFFDWLCQFPETEKSFEVKPFGEVRNVGPMYGSAMIVFPNRMYDNLLCHDQAIGPGWAGTFIKYRMFDAIREQKLDVEILTEHAAWHLLTDKSGAITGVLAQDPGGEVRINAKALVLATGGFGRSDEKLQKFFPYFFDCETPIHRFSVPTDTGDGIDMLEELGVKPDPEKMFVSIFGPAHHPFSYCIYRILEHSSCLSINMNGKRWQDETGGLMTGRFIIKNQPKEISWGIFSQEGIDRIGNEFINDPALREEAWLYKYYQEDLDEEIALPKPPVFRADTLEELAVKTSINPEALVATVKRYNEFCKKGKDEEFGKAAEHLRPVEKGPYYAIYGQRFSEGAFGGLRVNPKCEVTREDGTVIPGLYGVGDATSAMHRKGELAVISELTWAVASSYISGGNAAEYTDGREKR